MSTDALATDRADGAAQAGTHRVEATLAWAAWLLAVVSGAAGALLVATDQATGHPVLEQTPLSGIAGTAIALAYASVGLMLVLRRPRLVVGWLFVGIGVVAGLSNYAWGYVGLGATTGTSPGPFAVIEVAWLNNALTYSSWATLAILLVLLFPDGHPPTPAWRKVVVATVAVSAVLAVGLALEPGPTRLFEMFANPRPAPESAEPLIAIAIDLALVGVVLIGLLSVWGLTLRYHRASAIERRQLRWFAWGSALTLVGGAILVVVALATDADSRLTDLSWVVFAVASMTLPIAALIAILREGLYDIDRLISRTFVFGLLTAILAGLYSALIRLFNAVFVDVTGQSNELALVLTTLILATTFTPIKQRLEKIAERRFKTPHDGAPPASLAATSVAAAAPQPVDVDDLDRRIEAIARRVALEVLSGPGGPEAAGLGRDRSAPADPSGGPPG